MIGLVFFFTGKYQLMAIWPNHKRLSSILSFPFVGWPPFLYFFSGADFFQFIFKFSFLWSCTVNKVNRVKSRRAEKQLLVINVRPGSLKKKKKQVFKLLLWLVSFFGYYGLKQLNIRICGLTGHHQAKTTARRQTEVDQKIKQNAYS